MRGVREDALRWCIAAWVTEEDVQLRHSRHECYYCGAAVRKDGIIVHTCWQCPKRHDKDEAVTRQLRLEDQDMGAAAERSSAQRQDTARRRDSVARETDQDQTFSRRPPRDRSADPWGSRDPSQERYGRDRDPSGSPRPVQQPAASEDHGDINLYWGRRGADLSRGAGARYDTQPRTTQGGQGVRQNAPTNQGRVLGDKTSSRPQETWNSRSRSRDPPGEGQDRRAYVPSRAERFAQNSETVADPPATRPVPGRATGTAALARQTRFADAVVNSMSVDDYRDQHAHQEPSYHTWDTPDNSDAPGEPYSENDH